MEIVNGTEITYLYAQGQPFALHKKNVDESTCINYLHLDYQGSVMAITNQNGTLIEERNYDVWGRPRTANTLEYLLPNPFGNGSVVKRGYTFHEHLEEFNLINMNGRVYDPVLARFLNADPFLQDNTNGQNYNRYSYVLNIPTKYTDPSGYAYNGFSSTNQYLNTSGYDDFQNGQEQNQDFKSEIVRNELQESEYGSVTEITNDGEPYKLSDSERKDLSKYGVAPSYGIKVTSKSGVSSSGIDLGKVSQFCGNFGNGIQNSEINFTTGQPTFVNAGLQNAPFSPLDVVIIAGSVANLAVRGVASVGGLNLFKFGAIQTEKSVGWKTGDYMLQLVNKGSPKLNWKANFGALRSEIKLGKPIYDSFRLPNGNLIPTKGFLNAERWVLQNRGWTYDLNRGAWLPPIN